ncbi:MAG: hypothetical protein AAGF06_00635 [Pseudomonadota bacterium]
MKQNKTAWRLMALSLLIFSAVGVNKLVSGGQQAAKENMLELSLAFNELDNGLQQYLTSRDVSGLKALKATKSKFERSLKNASTSQSAGMFSFLPARMSSALGGGDVSSVDFSKLNSSWGESQKQVNALVKHTGKYEAFQKAILSTQATNVIMQAAYKELITFLVANHFSGNKIAVVQRQPWMADRVSLRLLWLQRPLAFSNPSLDVLKQESTMFSQQAVALLDAQLKDVAIESDELKAVLDKLYPAITNYSKSLDSVIVTGEALRKIEMQSLVTKSDFSATRKEVRTLAGRFDRDVGSTLFGLLTSNILFFSGLLLGFFGLFKLRKQAGLTVADADKKASDSEKESKTKKKLTSKKSSESKKNLDAKETIADIDKQRDSIEKSDKTAAVSTTMVKDKKDKVLIDDGVALSVVDSKLSTSIISDESIVKSDKAISVNEKSKVLAKKDTGSALNADDKKPEKPSDKVHGDKYTEKKPDKKGGKKKSFFGLREKSIKTAKPTDNMIVLEESVVDQENATVSISAGPATIDPINLDQAKAKPENVSQSIVLQTDIDKAYDAVVSDFEKRIDQLKAGDLSVLLDTEHKTLGNIGSGVNSITANMQLLVKALNVSADQTALLSEKRDVLISSRPQSGDDLQSLEKKAQIFVDRLELLSLKMKLKITKEQSSDPNAIDVYNELNRLKDIGLDVQRNLGELKNSYINEPELNTKHQMFDNLKLLSDKMEAIAAKFKMP